MKRTLDTTLSDGLALLRTDADDMLKGSIFAQAFKHQLDVLHKLAVNQERELALHRDNEAGNGLRRHIEQAATDNLKDMLPAEGTIIRANFGGKP